jgi:hypothetical protein
MSVDFPSLYQGGKKMNDNQKKTLTIAATAAGRILWFMGKAMTSGIRTRKGTGRKF